MKASIVPFEAASKQSNGCTIWPPAKTSILNRPPLISSTTLANCSAVRCTSSARGQAVDMRHWTFGCAMTWGASMIAVAVAAATMPPAVRRNLRRSLISLTPPGLVVRGVGSLDDLIGSQEQRLRDGEPEGLGGLEVDHQLEFRRL